MTDEEKAEEYANKKLHKLVYCSCCQNPDVKQAYLDGLAEGRKEYSEIPCTSCCITESLESDLTDLSYQFVDLEAKTKVIEKENEILKNIISTVLDKEDICYICQMKGQVLPECMRMENSKCLENMISLWSK